MNVLFRSIITGFGLRIGAEIAKKVSKRMFAEGSDNDEGDHEESRAAGADDDDLPGVTPDPPEI
jgi:hypothetical protein